MSCYELHPQEEEGIKFDCGHSGKKISGEVHDYNGPLAHYIMTLGSDGQARNLSVMFNANVFGNVNEHILILLGVVNSPDGGHAFSIIEPARRGKDEDLLPFSRDEFKSLFSDRTKKWFWEIADGIIVNEPRIKRNPSAKRKGAI